MQTATLLILMLLATPGGAQPGPAISDAVMVETAFGPVFVTPQLPAGHYGERYHGESYWLPGIDEGTSLVRKVIRSAKLKRDDGERVPLTRYRVKSRRVFVTDAPPFPGVFWMRVGDRHAWLAGVEKPLKADMAALEATADQIEAAAAPKQLAAAER
jgi:hypothetical protein